MNENTCVNCGAPLGEGQKFCGVCGSQQPQQPAYEQPVYEQPAYEAGYEQPVYDEQGAYQQPAYNQYGYEQPYGYAPVQTKKKSKLPLIIGISVAVVLVIVLALVLGGGGSKEERAIIGEWNGAAAIIDGEEMNLSGLDVPLVFKKDGTGYTSAGTAGNRTTLNFTWVYTHTDEDGDYRYTCTLSNGTETMYALYDPVDDEVILVMGGSSGILYERVG